jgi:predicted RNA-binding Zn ribbon-like protein
LALIQGFVNTRDVEASTDALDSPEGLREWFVTRGLISSDGSTDDADLRRTCALRESLRTLLEANHGEAPPVDAVALFNQQAASIRLRLEADISGRPTLEPGEGGIEGALGRLLTIVYTAVVDGTWRRLKVCPSDGCRWAFYDHSKNRSSTWCTMAVCGNRGKVRAYQQRRRAAR